VRLHELIESGLSVGVDLLPALLNFRVLSKHRSNAESQDRSKQQRSLNVHGGYLPIANEFDRDGATSAWCVNRSRFASRSRKRSRYFTHALALGVAIRRHGGLHQPTK
jgi:hypothetical protein